MPKQKHLNVRYTIRLSDYLSNEMIKHTLISGQDYSSFIRMTISTYLNNKTGTSDVYAMQNSPTSAVKTPFTGVSKLNDEVSTSTDDSYPADSSLYGWD